MMKNNNSAINIKHSGGFTLLELLLVVGLSATLIISFGRLSTLWANRELAELSGAHMNQITEVVESYIRTERPAAGGDVTADITANLPTGLTMTNPLRRDVSVQLRVTGSEYQAVIYTDGAIIPHSRLLPAARAAGAAGGLVNNLTTAGNIAESAFGLWTTDLAANFGGLAPTVTNDGGQLVSYLSFSIEEVFGAYLYRENLGDPDLNTMFTDLNMNGNAIRAASEVETNDLDVYNTATVDSLAVVGDTTFNGSVNITGAMGVADQLSVTNDVVVSNGNVVVSTGDIDAQSMTVNTVEAAVINAPDISATGITVDANTTLTSDLTVTGLVDIDGEIQANTLNANTLDVQDVTTNQMTVNNSVTVNGNAEITGSAIIDVLAVDDCVTIQPGGLNEEYGPNC